MTFYPEVRQLEAQRAMDRQRALTIACRHCDAQVGEECVSSAHFKRLQDVGL